MQDIRGVASPRFRGSISNWRKSREIAKLNAKLAEVETLKRKLEAIELK